MSNSKPVSARNAEIAIWVTIGISALIAVIDIKMGTISSATFTGYLFVYGLVCIIPYKIGRGSNASRYVYAVLMAITVLMMVGGVPTGEPKLDTIFSYLMLPLEGFIIYNLFTSESTAWFSGQNRKSEVKEFS